MTNVSFSNLVSVILMLVILGVILGLATSNTVEWLHPLRSQAAYDAALIENEVQRAKAEAEKAKEQAAAEVEIARLESAERRQRLLDELAVTRAQNWAALTRELARTGGYVGLITLSLCVVTVVTGLTIGAVKANRQSERWGEEYKRLRIAEARLNERLHRQYVQAKYQELFSGSIPQGVYDSSPQDDGREPMTVRQ